MVQIWVPETSRIDPESTLQTTLQTGRQMTSRFHIPDLRYPYARIRVFLRFYIEFGEVKQVPSKDWIRAPTRCQEWVNFLIYYGLFLGYIPR